MWTTLATLACFTAPLYYFFYRHQKDLAQLDEYHHDLYLQFRQLRDRLDEDQGRLHGLQFQLLCQQTELDEVWRLLDVAVGKTTSLQQQG